MKWYWWINNRVLVQYDSICSAVKWQLVCTFVYIMWFHYNFTSAKSHWAIMQFTHVLKLLTLQLFHPEVLLAPMPLDLWVFKVFKIAHAGKCDIAFWWYHSSQPMQKWIVIKPGKWQNGTNQKCAKCLTSCTPLPILSHSN